MSPSLFLLLSHQITPQQRQDGSISLSVTEFIELPQDLKELWSKTPPDLDSIGNYLEPLKTWLKSQAAKNDYVLIQGDFGACYIMVNFAFENGLIPVYSTTVREVSEEPGKDGEVKLVHHFRHQIFRKYGV